jgi:hypothetical protein
MYYDKIIGFKIPDQNKIGYLEKKYNFLSNIGSFKDAINIINEILNILDEGKVYSIKSADYYYTYAQWLGNLTEYKRSNEYLKDAIRNYSVNDFTLKSSIYDLIEYKYEL